MLALALAPVAVAAAAYVSIVHGGSSGRGAVPVAVGSPPRESLVVGPERPRVPQVDLSGVDAFRLPLRKQPRAALVFDVGSGEALWSLRPRKVVPIASLAKIMTALLVTERAGPDERVKITREALRYSGSGVGVLPRGKRVRLETLLNGMLIVSGNDAAIALADHVAGSQRRFVRLMNDRASALGLRCTRFADSYGLSGRTRSCARDLAVLTRMAMANRRITRVVRRRQVQFRFPIKGGHLFLSTHNPLFREGYQGAIGLKTGFTEQAGRCFVGVARRHGRTLGVILLHSPNPVRHASRLLDEGFRAEG